METTISYKDIFDAYSKSAYWSYVRDYDHTEPGEIKYIKRYWDTSDINRWNIIFDDPSENVQLNDGDYDSSELRVFLNTFTQE